MKKTLPEIVKEKVNPDPLLNGTEAADYINNSPATLPIWRHKGIGPSYVKVGRSVRYKKSALDSYLEKQTIQAGG